MIHQQREHFGVRLRRATAFAAVIAGALALVLAATPEAGAAVKQPNCAKQKAKVRKSKGKAKRAARKALKRCQNNRMVYNQVKNSRITGVRADGIEVDDIYCASGKWQSDAGSGGKVYKGGWYITNARVKNSKRYTAIVVGPVPGGTHEISIARNGKKWKVGWSSFDTPQDLGPATRTGARKTCARL